MEKEGEITAITNCSSSPRAVRMERGKQQQLLHKISLALGVVEWTEGEQLQLLQNISLSLWHLELTEGKQQQILQKFS